MTRRFAVVLIACGLSACGPHRITYVLPPAQPVQTTTKTTTHGHGIGPLLIGGGGFFAIINEMSPALLDWTGEVNTKDVCPAGFTRVTQYHTFLHGVLAGVTSWGGILNWWHPSYVEWTCINESAGLPTATPSPSTESDPSPQPTPTASAAPPAASGKSAGTS